MAPPTGPTEEELANISALWDEVIAKQEASAGVAGEALTTNENLAKAIAAQAAGVDKIATNQKLIDGIIEAQLGRKAEYLVESEKEFLLSQEVLKAEQQTLEKVQDRLDKLKVLKGMKEGEVGHAKLMNELGLEAGAKLDDLITESGKYITSLAERVKREKENNEKLKEGAEIAGVMGDAADNLLEKFFGMGKEADGFGSALLRASRRTGGLKAAAKDMWEKFKKGALDAERQADALWNKLKEGFIGGMAAGFSMLTDRFLEFDQQMIDLGRSTGQVGADFDDRVLAITDSLDDWGITSRDTTKAMTDLLGSSVAFTTASKAQQDSITNLTLRYQRFGLTAQATGKVLDVVMKGFKGNQVAAESVLKEVRALGSIYGTTEKAAQALSTAMSTLGAYSLPQATREFKSLSLSAAAAGVEVGDLLGLVGKFDTFEGAASAVGELNAMLGGPYLNTLDMINATEAQRVTKLQEAVAASGQAWSSMDRFQKKAIAAAMGISDMDKMNRIFGDGAMNIAEVNRKLEEEAALEEERADRAKELLSIQEMLAKALDEFFTANAEQLKGLGDLMKRFLKFALDTAEFFAGPMGKVVLVFGSIYAAIVPIATLTQSLVVLWNTKFVQAMIGAETVSIASMKSMGIAAGTLAIKMAGIVATAYALVQAYQAIKEGDTGKAAGWGAAAGGLIGGAIGFFTTGGIGTVPAAMLGAGIGASLTGGAAMMADGGIAKRGPTMINEEGPELIDFQGGERVYSNKETNQIFRQRTERSVRAAGTIFNGIREIRSDMQSSQNTLLRQNSESLREVSSVLRETGGKQEVNVTTKPANISLDGRVLKEFVLETVNDGITAAG